MKHQAVAIDLINLFLPRGCLACGERIPPEDVHGLVCLQCRTHLRPPPPPRCSRCQVPLGTAHPSEAPCLECSGWPEVLASARTVSIMEPPADALVHALKYGGWRALGEFMGRRMAGVSPRPSGNPVVIPVPTTTRRRRERGYNQARVLAQVVAGELGFPLVDALERRKGRTQVRLGPRERKANVDGAFQVRPGLGSRIWGTEVILIDDVLTTGATSKAAALELGSLGADSVHLVTFARTLPVGTERRNRSYG